jgi:hypothetical protein
MNVRQFAIMTLVIGCGLYAFATEMEQKRGPASVAKRNGVICGQGPTVTAAEERLNDKLGIGQSEAVTMMTGKFGKISNPRVTGVTINSTPASTNVPANYILCAAVAGD